MERETENHLNNLFRKVVAAVEKGSTRENITQDRSEIFLGSVILIFRFVVLCAQLASMYAEAGQKRLCFFVLVREILLFQVGLLPIVERLELSGFLVKVRDLLQNITESFAPFLQFPPGLHKSDPAAESNVFELLIAILDLMGKAEKQLMWGRRGLLFHGRVVEEV